MEDLTQGAQPQDVLEQPQPAPQPSPQPVLQQQEQLAQPKQAPAAPTEIKGDSVLETTMSIFEASTGRGYTHFMDAISAATQYQDEGLIDFNSLTQGLDAAQAAQATALAKAVYRETQSEIQRQHQAVHSMAGGEEQWNTAVQAFNSQAPSSVKTAVRALLEAGDVTAAGELVLHTAQGLGLVQSGELVQGGASGSVQGLSSTEFSEKLAELMNEVGNRSLESGIYQQKYQTLMQQRALGRKNGLN